MARPVAGKRTRIRTEIFIGKCWPRAPEAQRGVPQRGFGHGVVFGGKCFTQSFSTSRVGVASIDGQG